MLQTRLWMGSLLIGMAGLVLLEQAWFEPWYPFFFCFYLAATVFAAREFLNLLPEAVRPDAGLTLSFIAMLAVFSWWPAVVKAGQDVGGVGTWDLMIGGVVAGTILALVREVGRFRGPDRIVERVALTAFTLIYLGVLPCFLAQLRWLDFGYSTTALALAVFVPKGNDIGAYFTGKFLTGRLLGRHPMTPLLSPKKTWQGAVGGMLASVAVAVGINALSPVIPGRLIGAIFFGLTVGLAGIFGDLAESLIKRDVQTKDASHTVPGFGGVLDVVDSLLFAAPVAYLWFTAGERIARVLV
jgi:phosphatidate cytidylyltransferase